MSKLTFLRFECVGESASGKTSIFDVFSRQGGDLLGVVKWYAPWRRYTFWPSAGCIFDGSCLAEVVAFITEQMEARRHG